MDLGTVSSYETFFGFVERPFSLTPDPKFYFRSRSHSRAFDSLSLALSRREGLSLVTGDMGLGKTTLCSTLSNVLGRRHRVAFVGNPLASPEALVRLLLQDLGVVARAEVWSGRLADASRTEMLRWLDAFLLRLGSNRESAVVIIDDAHNLPAATADEVSALLGLHSNRDRALQVVLSAESLRRGVPAVAASLEQAISTRARLMALDRDEIDRYVAHRLVVAGAFTATLSPSAVEVLYNLSGGVPRLLNLLCERALQDSAASGSLRVEAGTIETAAAALELLRPRQKRFRWYDKQH
jgi:general secretion pathway protein A